MANDSKGLGAGWTTRLTLHPFFGGFTTVFGVVAGYLGSLYAESIAAATWPFFLPGVALSWQATSFWLATILFGTCFSSTLHAQSMAAKQTSDALATSTSRIEVQTTAIATAAGSLGDQVSAIETRTTALLKTAETLDEKTSEMQRQTVNVEQLVQRLHTLPPIGFLEEYARSGRLLVQIAGQPIANSTVDDLEAFIRSQLVCILKVVSAFDEDGGACRYGVNLMIFRSSVGLTRAEVEEIQGRLKFGESATDVSRLQGSLDLLRTLSVSTDSEGKPDPQLIDIALPVPMLSDSDTALTGPVLPGAPYTFLSSEPTVFEAASDLGKIQSDGKFTKFVIESMRGFFESRKDFIRSFMCFPIFPSGRPDAKPIGVLNIHRNKENASAAERIPLLNPLLMPLCAAVGTLLSARVNYIDTLRSELKETRHGHD